MTTHEQKREYLFQIRSNPSTNTWCTSDGKLGVRTDISNYVNPQLTEPEVIALLNAVDSGNWEVDILDELSGKIEPDSTRTIYINLEPPYKKHCLFGPLRQYVGVYVNRNFLREDSEKILHINCTYDYFFDKVTESPQIRQFYSERLEMTKAAQRDKKKTDEDAQAEQQRILREEYIAKNKKILEERLGSEDMTTSRALELAFQIAPDCWNVSNNLWETRTEAIMGRMGDIGITLYAPKDKVSGSCIKVGVIDSITRAPNRLGYVGFSAFGLEVQKAYTELFRIAKEAQQRKLQDEVAESYLVLTNAINNTGSKH